MKVVCRAACLAAVLASASRLRAQQSDTAPSAESQEEEPAPATAADIAALREEVRALRERLDKGDKKEPSEPAPPPRPLGYEGFWPWALPPEGISFSAYVQGQYESHADSQDQLAQGGSLLNQNRFSIRRARANLTGDWTYAALSLELDGNTTNGPQVDLRKAEASLQYRPDRSRPPLAMATVGLFDTPFGYELVESPRSRPFMERSNLSRAFWPGEPDLGVRIAGALSFFRWTISAVNGEPLGEKTSWTLQNPKEAMDVIFRFGADANPRPNMAVAADISALRGKGFHPGTDATKATVQWTDANGDGIVQTNEVQGVPGKAATPSQNFDRWAVGADLRLHYKWWLGATKVYGELVLGENMDRAMFIADPVAAGIDFRELGGYFGIVQELGPYALVGFRFDTYNPNSDAFDKRAGAKYAPLNQTLTTYSPMAALVLPDRARLVLQADINRNYFGRDATGVPTNLKTNAWTLRLQVQL
jgi:hypothetical protein